MSALERALSRAGRHMLIGGVAVVARGVRRLTDDVDATLWAEGVDLERLLERLGAQQIVGRIEDAAGFARQNQVLLLNHRPTRVDIDLSLAWLPFESEALECAEAVRIGGRSVRVARPDDLIVYKAIAARQRDLSDIEALLELHARTIDLQRVRRTVDELASALERPELVDGLDTIIRRVTTRAKERRPRRRKGRPAPK